MLPYPMDLNTTFMMLLRAICVTWIVLLTGCEATQLAENSHTPENSNAPIVRTEVDAQLREIITQYGLTGNPVSQPQPSITSPKAQLGMKLFFSKALSGNLDVACASCHHPLLGGGDNLSLSIGVDAAEPDLLGHGRALTNNQPPAIARNAPTTFNIGLWKHFLFHDGRVAATPDGITTPDKPYPQPDPLAGSNLVHAQARFPVISMHEMRGKNFDPHGNAQSCRDLLAGRLGGYRDAPKPLKPETSRYWLAEFRKAYQRPNATAAELITEQNIAEALSEYERSQVFVQNPWGKYVQGDLEAINATAKQGALLFFKRRGEGGFGCAECHRGDFFTDEQFRNALIPPIGPGKSSNPQIPAQWDEGRALVTQQDDDRFRFRTPSLLNVTETGPWGHNGAYTTLSGIVEHMLNPFKSAVYYDPAQLHQPNIPTQHLQRNLREILRSNSDLVGSNYTKQDVRQLVAFLQTLTDPCLKQPTCIGQWMPDPEHNDPTGLQLNAKINP